jgi:hypothetical protein
MSKRQQHRKATDILFSVEARVRFERGQQHEAVRDPRLPRNTRVREPRHKRERLAAGHTISTTNVSSATMRPSGTFASGLALMPS